MLPATCPRHLHQVPYPEPAIRKSPIFARADFPVDTINALQRRAPGPIWRSSLHGMILTAVRHVVPPIVTDRATHWTALCAAAPGASRIAAAMASACRFSSFALRQSQYVDHATTDHTSLSDSSRIIGISAASTAGTPDSQASFDRIAARSWACSISAHPARRAARPGRRDRTVAARPIERAAAAQCMGISTDAEQRLRSLQRDATGIAASAARMASVAAARMPSRSAPDISRSRRSPASR